MTSVSNSAGMIIQHYDMRVRDRDGDVYEGTTYFGFFSKPQLANQVGMPRREGAVAERCRTRAGGDRAFCRTEPPFPAPMLRMVDRIDAYVADGGPRGTGARRGADRGRSRVLVLRGPLLPGSVWPGSLGLESFLQLLKYAAWKRWGGPHEHGWQAVALETTACVESIAGRCFQPTRSDGCT